MSPYEVDILKMIENTLKNKIPWWGKIGTFECTFFLCIVGIQSLVVRLEEIKYEWVLAAEKK